MKSTFRIIISLLIGLLTVNFPISICFQSQSSSSQSQSQNSNNIPVMPTHPPAPLCSGFPGSVQWNKCWDNFHNQVQIFTQQMQVYQAQLLNMSNTVNDGATSSILVNGYSVRSKGLSMNSNSMNGKIHIEAFIGHPDKIATNVSEHQINWNLTYPKNVTGWLVLQPPQNVNISSIKHEIKDEKILISGPTDYTGGSSSSSSSSTVISNFGINDGFL